MKVKLCLLGNNYNEVFASFPGAEPSPYKMEYYQTQVLENKINTDFVLYA
jgi:hypothetical protein